MATTYAASAPTGHKKSLRAIDIANLARMEKVAEADIPGDTDGMSLNGDGPTERLAIAGDRLLVASRCTGLLSLDARGLGPSKHLYVPLATR